MDRVLLIVDDIQYSRHIEMTLRKVGFEVEPLNNEYGLNDSLLTFNPDYVVCRGQSSRLSAVSVSKKLRDQGAKFSGKVLLVFPQNYQIPNEELLKMKVDLVLFEPLSTLRLAIQLFMFNQADLEFIKDKLLKFAITDNQFRNYEQQLLRHAGTTIDTEIQIISGLSSAPSSASDVLAIAAVSEAHGAPRQNSVGAVHLSNIEVSTPESLLNAEPLSTDALNSPNELRLRIEAYNRVIGNVDQDLKVGLNKRQTKRVFNQQQKDLIENKKSATGFSDTDGAKEDLDRAKRAFAAALFRKS